MNIAVILAGGKGLRLGAQIPKQMLILGDKPVISWSVDTFHKSKLIDQIIIVSEKNLVQEIKLLFPENLYPKILNIIEGGQERSDSSFNALLSAQFNNEDIFLFHDAARPFVSEEIIEQIIENVKITGACGTYVQSTDTIAIISDSLVESIPDRKTIFQAQTPQCFKYEIIKKAHLKQKNENVTNTTDDVSLVLNINYKISSIPGSYKNIKITNEFDLKFAEFLISDGCTC